MPDDILSIFNESEGLNAKVFSLVRQKLLASLAAPGPERGLRNIRPPHGWKSPLS